MSKDIEDLDECVTLLQWMLVRRRVLSAHELYSTIQCRNASSDLDDIEDVEDDKIVTARILDYSRGFVELLEGSDAGVQFVHESVRQFLTSIESKAGHSQHSQPPSSQFSVEMCNLVVAEGCLQYLFNLCRGPPLTTDVFQGYPLARYAAKYWWRHLQMTSSSHNHQAISLAEKLLIGDANNLLKWVQMYNIDNDDDEDETDRGPWLSLETSSLCQPIYYLASTGLSALLNTKFLQTADLNAKRGIFGTALGTASAHGHKDIAQLLLDNGADVNAEGRRYNNALGSASAYGHEEVVRLLLDRGADIDPLSGWYGHAIGTAFASSHNKVIDLLMQQSADVMNAYKWDQEESEAPSQYSYKHLSQMVLNQDADDDLDLADLNDKLQIASAHGDIELVRQLLSRGASLIADGGDYGNALHTASAYGRKEVVEYLLDQGAGINAVGGWHGDALGAATARSHTDLLEYLLDRGADVNGLDGKGNALYAASALGNMEVVQLLIDRGANVNARGRELGSALQAATYLGNTKIVQLLLNNGAHSEIPSERDPHRDPGSKLPTIEDALADAVERGLGRDADPDPFDSSDDHTIHSLGTAIDTLVSSSNSNEEH